VKSTQQNKNTCDNISEEINKMFNKLQIEDYEFKKLYRSKKQD
jgi:hypothetical protein